jgi:hypothetical protein
MTQSRGILTVEMLAGPNAPREPRYNGSMIAVEPALNYIIKLPRACAIGFSRLIHTGAGSKKDHLFHVDTWQFYIDSFREAIVRFLLFLFKKSYGRKEKQETRGRGYCKAL